MLGARSAITVSRVFARQILDSRGRPTVEVEVILSDGTFGRVAVPSGSSVGKLEALEIRDGDPARYVGYGVTKPVQNINSKIADALTGISPFDQKSVDEILLSLDGTPDKSNLGANATIGVSLAVARAAAESLGIPLYKYLGGEIAREMPVPLVNVLNGGLHADNSLDFQEFMIMPVGAQTFADAVRMCAEVFFRLREVLKKMGHPTNTGDEGGFAPNFKDNSEACDALVEAIEKSGYKAPGDFSIAMDVAASTLYDGTSYKFSGKSLTSDELISYYEEMVSKYPIASIEDAMAEDDVAGWKAITERLGQKIQLVGDDLFVTNPTLINNGIKRGLANAVLVKPNQIGTLTETIDAIRSAQQGNYNVIVSHRSGETEDVTISHIAVAANCGQIKSGSFSRSERLAKYNELLRIEADLGKSALFSGVI
ncbi:phosphopyruvate hydratase [Anaplasma capra]|uniref:phosphopyruvate hydratase n=1 Tax=Anaplasma capra TaxID=1562740 RepID=UPI0021D59694|nr:phosphopyruvate hydratase [Anaplasma capra]MCU7611653.1 phosphopyruvate hydratase [Anaplasma capra]MCU7612198.1 phosphopyruvate hydratase [Anaplasma capra]